MIRRDFLGGIFAALGGTSIDSDQPVTGDAGWLKWALDKHGEDVVCEQITDLLATSSFSIRSLKSRLNRISGKARREKSRREKRERHAGDVQVYHGPVLIDAALAGWLISGSRDCTTANRKAVSVATSDKDYAVIVGEQRHVIPAGSRILIDARQTVGETMACEVVRTAHGDVRCHMWQRQQGWIAEPGRLLPRFAAASDDGGRAYQIVERRHVGLLGLPVS